MVLDNYRKSINENKIVRWEETSNYPLGEKTGVVSIAPVWNDKGICTHLIGSVHDITELKQKEKELLRISKAVESTSDAIGMSDPRGNHFYHNRAFTELFGYTAKELDAAGGPSAVYADKSDAKKVFDNIMSGKSWNGEIEMVSKSGRKFPALVRADAIKDEAQNITGLIGIVTDITESKKISKDLLESKKDLQKLAGRLIVTQEKELRRLARELHDDLTQQLAVMAIDAGNIIQQFKDLPPAVFSTVSYIKDRLIKVSKNVHDMSRALHPSILDDLGLVRAVKSECSNFSSRMGIAVVFTPKNVPDYVAGNIALTIYRIIQEGLSNIAKHAKTKNAYVFLEGHDDSMMLTIRDTGKGFDPAQVRHYPALGLGSIRERVRLVNGEFSITSRPGKGTSIEVKIPLKDE
jgi:PAS domain S-box-containing protein